jgi:hypothetical protein
MLLTRIHALSLPFLQQSVGYILEYSGPKDSPRDTTVHVSVPVEYPEFFVFGGGGGYVTNFIEGRGSTNLVEDRGQRKWGSGSVCPLVRGSTQFAND